MAAASVYQGWTSALHQAASVAFADYSAGKTAWTTLNKLLDVVLAQTKSQYGFIGHAVETSPGKKVMLVEAVTNITWHPSMDKLVVPKGLEFGLDHGGLHVEPYLTGKPLVENNPPKHPRSIGIPNAHPPLNTLLGLPVFSGGVSIGVLEIANREGGYSTEMIPYLRECADAIGVLLRLFTNAPISTAPCEPELDFNVGELSFSVIQSISDAIIVTDAELKVKLLNNGSMRLYGFTQQEQARNRLITDLLVLPQLAKIEWFKFVQNVLEANERYTPEGGDGIARDVGGRDVPVAVTINSFLFSRRRYLCFIIRDQRTKRNYEQKMRFLSFLSHELRTPLQVIVSGLQELMFSAEHQSPTAESQMRLLIESSNMITRIVNSVLDLSRLESGTVASSVTVCSVREMLSAIEAMLRPYKRNNAVELRIECDASVPGLVKLDRVKVEHVLINLTNNALRHTSQGYVKISVSSSSSAANTAHVLHFDVIDTGSGIRAEDMPKLFHLYQVLDAPSSMHSAGTGLGLVIAKTFSQLLGGDITATSEQGRGSKFSFFLPFTPIPDDAPMEPHARSAHKRRLSLDQPEPEALRGRRVLVVDDNPVLRAVLKRALTRDGCITAEAEDGKQAIGALASFRPDLILLDLIMPTMDGFATAHAIRNDLKLHIPIVGLTGCTLESDLQRCISSGFNTCLIKPVSSQVLRDTLISILAEAESDSPLTPRRT